MTLVSPHNLPVPSAGRAEREWEGWLSSYRQQHRSRGPFLCWEYKLSPHISPDCSVLLIRFRTSIPALLLPCLLPAPHPHDGKTHHCLPCWGALRECCGRCTQKLCERAVRQTKTPQCTPSPNASRSRDQGVHWGGILGMRQLHVWLFWLLCLSSWHCQSLARWRCRDPHSETAEAVGEMSGKIRMGPGWPSLRSEEKGTTIYEIYLDSVNTWRRKVRSATSQKPQESMLLQNRKFRKGFPHSPQKTIYLCSVGGLLFKSVPLLSSLTNKLTPGIAPVYNQSEIHPAIPHIQKINENIFSALLLKAE